MLFILSARRPNRATRRRPRSHPRDRLLIAVGGATGHLGAYRLEAVIGRGATSTVYRARRAGDVTNQVVAVKRQSPQASPEVVGRLQQEADILARLDHPHIVRVLELVPDGAGVAIVMQHAPGGSLATLLAAKGGLSAEEVVKVAAPLADALAWAHRRRVVHGDVKPANILFTSGGEPLLSDFGAARPAGQADAGVELLGTSGYVDPAVLGGARPDERSDVYGLGAVCHEMLTGRPPATGAGTGATALSFPAEGPAALATVLRRALAPSPADRYASAEDMATALRDAVRATPARSGPVGPGGGDRRTGRSLPSPAGPPTRSFGPRPPRPATPRGPGPSRPRRRLAVVVSVGLTLVAVAGGAVVSTPTGTSRPTSGQCPPVNTPLRADVDGDGCPSPVAWSGNVLEVEGHRYRLGEPGDTVVLGDWDCDGRDTPALYRPGGAVFFYDGWAQDGRPLPAASRGDHLPAGRPEVRHGEDGCDRVVVR